MKAIKTLIIALSVLSTSTANACFLYAHDECLIEFTGHGPWALKFSTGDIDRAVVHGMTWSDCNKYASKFNGICFTSSSDGAPAVRDAVHAPSIACPPNTNPVYILMCSAPDSQGKLSYVVGDDVVYRDGKAYCASSIEPATVYYVPVCREKQP